MATQLHAWKQEGSLWLWHYTGGSRNFAGWHLTADASGSHSLVEMLSALSLEAAGAFRTLRVSSPTQSILAVPNNRSAAWVAPSKLRIELSEISACWRFPLSGEVATLTLGAEWLPRLQQAVAEVPKGKGDFSIGGNESGSQRVWFWWKLGA
jgi:hypothetical protein